MARCISGYVYTGECAILDLFPSPLYVIESVNKTLNRYRAVTNQLDFVLKQGHFKDDEKIPWTAYRCVIFRPCLLMYVLFLLFFCYCSCCMYVKLYI